MKKKSKWITIALIVSLFCLQFPEISKAESTVSARSAILMEQHTGRILFEKDAYKKRRIASITKIMTAILAIESGKMNEIVKVSDRAAGAEGSSIYLQPGEKIKLEDLVYGLMLRSGNDAAVAIAEHVGGSLEGFAFLMNQKAEEIGMTNTHFSNPHGLDDHEDHYSTAYDMAILTRYAMMNNTYKKISGAKVHRAPNPNETWDRVWNNKNRLLTELYDYCTGGKTGYTKRARRTLVTTASKNDLDLIAVTINASDDWNDHIWMYETAFKNVKMLEIIPKGTIKDIQDKVYKNKVYIKRAFSYPTLSKEKDKYRIEYELLEPKKEWSKGKNTPDIVGDVIIYFDAKPIKKLPIYFGKGFDDETSFYQLFKKQFAGTIGVRRDG